jgi:hypothetical protein
MSSLTGALPSTAVARCGLWTIINTGVCTAGGSDAIHQTEEAIRSIVKYQVATGCRTCTVILLLYGDAFVMLERADEADEILDGYGVRTRDQFNP